MRTPFQVFNRKYIGSKRLLRDRLCARILESADPPDSILDGFSGTGSMTAAFHAAGVRRIVAVDNLRSNCVILRGFLAAPDPARADALLERCNAVEGSRGYITESFAGTYFTGENCRKMDSIREEMERMRNSGEIDAAEHDYLLSSFLLAADRAANTVGQYDAYLKNIDGRTAAGGRHLVDDRVHEPFLLRPLAAFDGGRDAKQLIEVKEGDMLALLPGIDVQVAYFDPPYNDRQYAANYHVLENLCRWEKPPLYGKTRKFRAPELSSPFCRKREARGAMQSLLARSRSPSVFLSYSGEGILERDEILSLLRRHGEADCAEIPYRVFGNGAGVSRDRGVVEYLFHLRRA